jgi:hypothetical protein
VQQVAPDDGDRHRGRDHRREQGVRKNGCQRAKRESSSRAAASDRPIDTGTPTTTKYSVLTRACQKSGVCSSWA